MGHKQPQIVAGLEPACVRVCPTRALTFGPANEVMGKMERRAAGRTASADWRAGLWK